MNKVVRDGMVAVLYSPGHGAGWSTWARPEIRQDIVFDPAIVGLVEQEKFEELEAFVALKYPGLFTGGLEQLQIRWVTEGLQFRITDYDGNESIEFRNNIDWYTA